MAEQPVKPSRRSGQPHNNFFNANFKTAKRVRPLLEMAMTSSQCEGVDWDTLTVESNILTDSQDLRAQYADLVAKARLRQYPKVWLGFVVEHKSSPAPDVMVQLMGYEWALNRQGANKVFSIILYHGLTGWHKEKTLQAFQRAGLPDEAVSDYERGRMDFEAIFLWLRDPQVQARVRQMPMEVQLLLHAMANIWEAVVEDLQVWFEQFQPLPAEEELELTRSVFEYFLQVGGSAYKIEELRYKLEAMKPGDEHMQVTQEKWLEWLPMTVGEVRDQGKEEGLAEGLAEGLERGLVKGREEGLERGVQQMAIEMARRCIEDGMSDAEIQRYTRLTPVKIKGLRNGRNDSGD